MASSLPAERFWRQQGLDTYLGSQVSRYRVVYSRYGARRPLLYLAGPRDPMQVRWRMGMGT